MSGGTFLILALTGATATYIAQLIDARRWWGVLGTLFTLIALLTLSIGLVTRATRADHWPLSNRFEFALCCVWTMLAFHLLLERGMGAPSGGPFVLPLALLLTLWASGRPDAEQMIRPLTPVLRTAWFPLHVGCSAIAYGAFTVAGGFGTQLLASDWLRQKGLIITASPERIENSVWRAVGLGFPWLTLAMLTGAIWAQVAWGRYWDWDPKESWTLVTWLTYLILLHGRALRGWTGRRVAWLALIGLSAVAFTFLGVGWLVRTLRLESVHIF